ncbi:DSD1 family PLP-dependent enzyme [Stenotrophomonas sp. 24(2023)]|uniref:DSD1 family PLP-dependent enzyme n=1 Tax=Stenotrophomonas sp. 24(2023) TaxID=3068324 RepID=UPI0027DFEB51|nr:DSD1 family PLP-dependent enzyme [Stenotrophomonas sp. 24(2023)]WMJ69292.1 DSD1 family PLP-dependent enzyme [Stenotrophomonas sp. 24(2023)]
MDTLLMDTPCLLLDAAKMARNIARLQAHLAPLGPRLRPHLKTAKSVQVAARQLGDSAIGATVSTLREADVFAAAGVRDIIYAVGIAPHKLDRVHALRQQGCDLAIVLDAMAQADAVADAARRLGDTFPVLLEIDCDGHRSGLRPGDPHIVAIADRLRAGGVELRGVLTHAGESYNATTPDALAAFAEQERRAAVQVADTLAAAGHPCTVVSVGSTPTAHFARNLHGITEVRAGVYVFFDLVMAGIGVCRREDIALSVLTRVIGHQQDKGWILVDAGWMALSRDRGTAGQAIDQGYGVVCDAQGEEIEGLIVVQANQEHGILALRPGSRAALPTLPIGTRLRILPNHACATAAQFDGYHVLDAATDTIPFWPRFRGW